MYHQLYWLFCGILVTCVAARDFKRAGLMRSNGERLSKTLHLRCSFYSLALCLIVLEMGFFHFSQSDGFNFTHAGKNWINRYWHPLNKYGYRDTDYSSEIERRCKKILVVGDSFVAGHGIENTSDRFVDHIRKEFEPDYCTYAIAQNGWSTIDELKAVQEFPYEPNVVILSYVLNDIGEVLPDAGRWYPKAPSQTVLAGFVEQSYLFNFFYWRIYRLTSLEGANYGQQMLSAYENDQQWKAYEVYLRRFIEYTRSKNARLVVVVWPWLTDMQRSVPAVEKITRYFGENNVTTVNLYEHLGSRDPSSIVVNSVDGHPNVATHREAFQVMLPAIREEL